MSTGGPTDPNATELLLRRYREGDRQALEMLFLKHVDAVERIVRVRTGPFLRSRHLLEDVVQEVFVEVCGSVGGYEHRGDAQFVDWLARVTENKIRNLAKQERAKKRSAPTPVLSLQALRSRAEGTTVWDVADDTSVPPDKIAAKEMCEIVDDCLAAEEVEAHREVILKRKYAQGDWAWIASELGCPTAHAAEELFQRAFQKLKERVRRRVGEAGGTR